MSLSFPSVGGGRGSSGGEGGMFLKLESGAKINGVLRGDFKMGRVHWVQSESRYRDCLGGDCVFCESGDEPKTRAKINFVTKEGGVWVAKIWDMSMRSFIDLRELQENGYPLDETAISISRKGEKKDTKWIVLPLKNNGGLTAKDFKAIAAVPLNVLGEGKATADAPELEEADANEDIPF